jgi:hypothetical protein
MDKRRAQGLIIALTPKIKSCPACRGSGRPPDCSWTVEDLPCPYCMGEGKVPLDRCACGMPASLVHRSGIGYCGDEKCAKLRLDEQVIIASGEDFMYDYAYNLVHNFADLPDGQKGDSLDS